MAAGERETLSPKCKSMSRLNDSNDSPRAMGVVGQHSSIEQPEDAEDPCASLSHNSKEASKKGLFLNDEPSSNVAAFEVFVDS